MNKLIIMTASSSSNGPLVEVEKGEEKPTGIKLLVLGDSGVGKTSLTQRFVHDTVPGGHSPTIAYDIDFKTHTILDLRTVKFTIVDTAGLERYPYNK